MPDRCTLYITNLTSDNLVPVSSPAPCQMDIWNFPTLVRLMTAPVTVQFFTGSSDEDDGAEQNYAFSTNEGQTVIDVYATSDNGSVHYLSVRSKGATQPQYCVLAIASSNTIPGTAASALKWHALTGVTTATPQSHKAPPYEIGPISTDNMSMGIAIVDLGYVFGDTLAATYFQAISSNNLSQTQKEQLSTAVVNAINFGGYTSSWMTTYWNEVKHLALSSLSMPGTHDAGMAVLTLSTDGSDACNTQTQTLTIGGQLSAGSRYFDLRPATWDTLSGFYLSHWSDKVGGVYGSAGQSLNDALQEVVDYFQSTDSVTGVQPANECVILKFSHFGAISQELGTWMLDTLDNTAFQNLVSTVKNTLGSYLFTSTNATINLNQQTLHTLSGNGNRVLAVFDLGQQGDNDFPVSLVNTAQGIFGYLDDTTDPPSGVTANMVVYDNFANSDDLDDMIEDQTDKFNNYKHSVEKSFLLSWTLTLSTWDLTVGSDCISTLAAEADPQLLPNMNQWMSYGTVSASNAKRPNVLFIDYIGQYKDYAVVTAMQLNTFR
jgi:hypothetical protein